MERAKEVWAGKVTIAYPHNGSVRQEWHHSDLMAWITDMRNAFMGVAEELAKRYGADAKEIFALIESRRNIIAEVYQPGLYIAGNRNANVKQFLATPAEWCWMLDTDHIYDEFTLYRLLEIADAVERPIVSALYFGFLNGQVSPMWFNRLESGEYSSVTDIGPDQPQKIDCAGMGCVLIHRSVFEKMEEANFDTVWNWFGHDLTEAHGWPERMGEDMTFFDRCFQLGIPVYGDARIAIGHMKTFNLDFEQVKKLVPQRKPDEPINKRVLRAVV